MSRKRKTIKVNELLARANRLLRVSPPEATDFRKGVALLLEFALHETGNYEGFNYVEWMKEGGYQRWCAAGSPPDPTPFLGDKTRRHYFGAGDAPKKTPAGRLSILDYPEQIDPNWADEVPL